MDPCHILEIENKIEKMTAELFYWINAILFLGIVGYLWFRKADGKPVRLKMGGHRFEKRLAEAEPAGQGEDGSAGSRNLNVLFMYNGHTWDAYDVLGCPAGASLERAVAAFNAEKAKASPESVEFLEAALEAIRSAHVGMKAQ